MDRHRVLLVGEDDAALEETRNVDGDSREQSTEDELERVRRTRADREKRREREEIDRREPQMRHRAESVDPNEREGAARQPIGTVAPMNRIHAVLLRRAIEEAEQPVM